MAAVYYLGVLSKGSAKLTTMKKVRKGAGVRAGIRTLGLAACLLAACRWVVITWVVTQHVVECTHADCNTPTPPTQPPANGSPGHVTVDGSHWPNEPSPELIGRYNLTMCPWSRQEAFTQSPAYGPFGAASHSIILALNSLNITYVLNSGSALGALRNGGFVPGDGDMDIVIPVWLNNHPTCPMFRSLWCPEANHVPPRVHVLRGNGPPRESLCAFERWEWAHVGLRYLERTISQELFPNVSFALPEGRTHTARAVLRVAMDPNTAPRPYFTADLVYTFSDVTPNRTAVPPLSTRELCVCTWGHARALCAANTDTYVPALYGADWNVPQAKKDMFQSHAPQQQKKPLEGEELRRRMVMQRLLRRARA